MRIRKFFFYSLVHRKKSLSRLLPVVHSQFITLHNVSFSDFKINEIKIYFD